MMGTSGIQAHKKIVRELLKGLGVLLLLVLMMMWLAGAFIDKVEPGPPVAESSPAPVKTVKVVRETFPVMRDQVGTVTSQALAQVSSRIMAQVKEIFVREGDQVVGAVTAGQSHGVDRGAGREGGVSPQLPTKPARAGTLLARLDDRDILARLQQAEAQISAMEKAVTVGKARLTGARAQVDAARASRDNVLADFRRYEDLYRHQAATGQQLGQVRAQKDVAESQVQARVQEVQAAQGEIDRTLAQKQQAEAAAAEARAMLEHTFIRAPFTGRVIKKSIEVGDMASPGQPLFVVQGSSSPELHAGLSESLLPRLTPGQEMKVHVDALNRTFVGKLREIVPMSDPSTRTVLIKVSLPPDPGLVNGLFGRVQVPSGVYESLVVPAEAIRRVGQLTLVEVVEADGIPRRRFVTVGKEHDGVVEVLSGLKENEEVILP